MGAIQELQEFSRVRGASEHHCICPYPPQQMGRNTIQMFWPACKVTAAHTQTHCLSPFHLQREQEGSMGHYWAHLASLSGIVPAQQTDMHGCCRHSLGCTSLPKLPTKHILHKGCSITRLCFQDQKRQLLCLIQINKLRKSNKIKRKKNIPPIKVQEKSPGEKKPKETEISNLHDKEFKEIVIRMLTKIEIKIEKVRKDFN